MRREFFVPSLWAVDVAPRLDVPPRDLVLDGAPPIVTDPAVLAIKSLPYEGGFGDDLERLTSQMFAAMYGAGIGVGLSAVQIGIHLRVCVVDVYGLDPTRRSPRVFVNPEIIASNKEIPMREGCLSAPGKFGHVPRATGIKLRWLNERGAADCEELGGFLAHILQHEIDHMDGIMCTSKMIGGARG